MTVEFRHFLIGIWKFALTAFEDATGAKLGELKTFWLVAAGPSAGSLGVKVSTVAPRDFAFAVAAFRSIRAHLRSRSRAAADYKSSKK
jgi:hypothetical protein